MVVDGREMKGKETPGGLWDKWGGRDGGQETPGGLWEK